MTSDWEAKIIVNCYFINYVERGHSTVNKVGPNNPLAYLTK